LTTRSWPVAVLVMGASVLAVLWPFDQSRPPALAKSSCETTWTSSALTDTWNQVSTFQTARDLVTNKDPVGTYRVFHDSSPIKALDANRPGSVTGASSFKIIDPDQTPLSTSDNDYKESLGKVQRFLQTTSSFDTRDESAEANAQAAQLAIWSALGQLDLKVELAKRAKADVWTNAVAAYTAQIDAAKDDDRELPPDRIYSQMDHDQQGGTIAIDVAVSDIRATMNNQFVTVSDVVSSVSTRTAVDGLGISKVELPDLLPGRTQSVTVRWSGFIPAGTLLQAQYPKGKGQKTQTTGYLLTLQPVYAAIEHVQVRGNGTC
jgi:hypothetical protein